MNLIDKLKEGSLEKTDTARSVAEVLGQMSIAKKFPRQMAVVEQKVYNTCKNKAFAKTAFYSVPRAGGAITGPSIRLAEAIVYALGNISFGITTNEEEENSTRYTVYAIDLESNTRVERTYVRKHERKVKDKKTQQTRIIPIIDPSQQYEIVAADATKRLRACLFNIIPKYLLDFAQETCRQTLLREEQTSPEEVEKIVKAFEEFNITRNQLEVKIEKQLSKVEASDVVLLRGTYNTLKQGIATKDEVFQSESK